MAMGLDTKKRQKTVITLSWEAGRGMEDTQVCTLQGAQRDLKPEPVNTRVRDLPS